MLRRAEAIPTTPLAVTAIVVIGLLARCRQYFGNPSYWYDEAYILLDVFERSATELLGALQYNVVAPPVFLWILRGLYLVAGSAEWVMRSPAMIASAASVLVMIPLARRVLGSRGWQYTVALCAISCHGVELACLVRPYALDFLVTELILLTTYAYLIPATPARKWFDPSAGLVAAAAVGPWISFPSVFVLGGASLALLVDAMRKPVRRRWLFWFTLNVLFLSSTAALWTASAQYLYYPGLQDHWAQQFLNVSSVSATLVSLARCVIRIGDYGTTGMGVPLGLFAALGLAVLWKRSQPLAVLLIGPIALAAMAAALRRYPLGERLAFFVLPNLWLAAAAGIGVIVDRLNRRWAWAGVAVAAALLLPDAARTAKDLIVVQPKADFRAAFSYVRAHWEVGDRLWVSHPEVYQLYFGTDATLLGAYTPAEVVEQVARAGRLWMVYTPQAPGRTNFPEVFRRVQAVSGRPSQQHSVSGLEIALYEVSRDAPR